MALPAIPAAYSAIVSLIARKGITEATKKYGAKTIKEVKDYTINLNKRVKGKGDKYLTEDGFVFKMTKDGKLTDGDLTFNSLKEMKKVIDVQKLPDISSFRIPKRDGGFPDLNKDGKITYADVLKGRGVFQEGGSIDDQMQMVMNQPMLPDEEMEDNYLNFIIDEALDEEEEDMLMSKLEQDEQLSMLFDKVLEVASEFAGSGPVEGPGSGVSDSIPARLSDGEFVFTAKATEQIGADELMRMMKDAEADADRQGMQEGGMMMEEEEVDQFGRPIDSDIARDELKKNMMSVNPRYR